MYKQRQWADSDSSICCTCPSEQEPQQLCIAHHHSFVGDCSPPDFLIKCHTTPFKQDNLGKTSISLYLAGEGVRDQCHCHHHHQV